MIHIRVPGSCANLGPGFDSIGVALNVYLDLQAERAEYWSFKAGSSMVEGMPKGEDNVIYQAASFTAMQYGFSSLPPYRVSVSSQIPIARGLGSSAAAIVAGIELADVILNLQLTTDDKISLASQMEGHPDNVAPSVTGGGVIAHQEGKKVRWTSVQFEGLAFLAAIPSFDLKTSEARDVLPRELSYKQAVEASAVANVFIAALLKEDWELAGEMMEKDLFHQPYRGELMPHYDELRHYLKGQQVYGTFMSGAGPTVMSLVEKPFIHQVRKRAENAYPDFEWKALDVDYTGPVVTTGWVEAK